MADDIQAILRLLESCFYRHILAVMSGAVSDEQVVFSRTPAKRDKQKRKLWSLACAGLAMRGVDIVPFELTGSAALPYRRRFVADQSATLRRMVCVTDRVRVHLLELFADGSLHRACSTQEGLDLGERLFYSLFTYDFPDVASIADGYPALRKGLIEVLHVTAREFDAMRAMDDAHWRSLATGSHEFGTFDPARARG